MLRISPTINVNKCWDQYANHIKYLKPHGNGGALRNVRAPEYISLY